MSIPKELNAVLRAKHGVIHREQARQAGLTDDQIDRLTRSGQWRRLVPRVYGADAFAATWHAWCCAAVLTAGPGGVLIGPTAAALRHWTEETLPVSVAVPRGRRVRLDVPAVRVHRLDVRDDEIVIVNGLATTTRLRTALDIAHLLPLGDAQQIIDRMLVLGVVELEPLVTAVEGSGRRGSAQARRLMRSAADLAASEAERLTHKLLRASDITGWHANHEITVAGRTLTVDIAFVDLKIAVEIKGWAFHSVPDRAKSDDRRGLIFNWQVGLCCPSPGTTSSPIPNGLWRRYGPRSPSVPRPCEVVGERKPR